MPPKEYSVETLRRALQVRETNLLLLGSRDVMSNYFAAKEFVVAAKLYEEVIGEKPKTGINVAHLEEVIKATEGTLRDLLEANKSIVDTAKEMLQKGH